MANDAFSDERNIVLAFYVITAFLAVNVQPQIVGVLYALFIMGYVLDLNKAFGIERIQIFRGKVDFFKPVLIGAVLFLGWLMVLNFLSGFFSPETHSAIDTTILNKIYQQSSVVINFDNPFLKLSTFGFVIPIAETMFLAVLIGMWAKWLSTSVLNNGTFDRKKFLVYFLVGVTYSLFHVFVRLQNATTPTDLNFSMISDILFFGASTLVVVKFKELSQATWFHIFTNTAVVAKGLGFI